MSLTRNPSDPATQADLARVTESVGRDRKELDVLLVELPNMLQHAVEAGGRTILAELAKEDSELANRLMERQFSHFHRRAGDEVAQWVGKRVILAIVTIVFTAGVAWAVMSGRLR